MLIATDMLITIGHKYDNVNRAQILLTATAWATADYDKANLAQGH